MFFNPDFMIDRIFSFLSCSSSVALLATFSSVIALPSSAAFPTDSQELKFNKDSDIGELKKLLQQGELVKFYQTAHTHMGSLSGVTSEGEFPRTSWIGYC
nr:hypothetical protein [Akkermansia muciniphila]